MFVYEVDIVWPARLPLVILYSIDVVKNYLNSYSLTETVTLTMKQLKTRNEKV